MLNTYEKNVTSLGDQRKEYDKVIWTFIEFDVDLCYSCTAQILGQLVSCLEVCRWVQIDRLACIPL